MFYMSGRRLPLPGERRSEVLDLFTHKKLSEKEIDALEDRASSLSFSGQTAEAARAYEQVAEAYLGDNNLIFANTCYTAFKLWLKADDSKEALRLAERSLKVLDDSGWLEKSMEQWLQLKQMMDEMKSAGHPAESQALADRMNVKLAKLGFMLLPSGPEKPPTVCPACGADLPETAPGKTIVCSYCGYRLRI